jgi:hypothetical protein
MKMNRPLKVLSTLSVAAALGANSASAKQIVFNSGKEARIDATSMQRGLQASPLLINFELPSLEIDDLVDANGHVEIKSPGLVPLLEEGHPQLLTTGVNFAVPAGYEPKLTIIEQQEEVISDLVVKPVQRKYRCGGGSEMQSNWQGIYNSSAVASHVVARVEPVGFMQGLRLDRVAVTPTLVNVKDRTVRVITKLVARVDFVKVGEARTKQLGAGMFSLASKVVPNLVEASVTRGAAEKMLIIAADSLVDTMKQFVDWKTANGIHVDLVKYSDVGGTKEKAQQYVQKYYDDSEVKPSYLLFVGDGKLVPPFMMKTSSGSAASDYPFSKLSGDDIVPDLLYGRFVAANEKELLTQIERTIQYEKSPSVSESWYEKGSTVTSNEGSNPSDKQYGETIATSLLANTYSSVDLFNQGDKNATAKNIVEALEEGRSWLTYIGHGSGTSWGSTNTSFSTTTIKGVKNAGKLPVVVDVACMNGAYVTVQNCFGKTWMTSEQDGQPSGAVAYYGGSVNISWHPPAVMSTGIAKYHFEKPVRTMGGSVLAGQMYLIEKSGTGSSVSDNLTWYNLFGDPSLMMRTDLVKALNVTYDMQEDGVAVKVTSGDADLANAKVAITNENGLLQSGVTNEQGILKLAKPARGAYTLTVTGYNVEPFQTNLSM